MVRIGIEKNYQMDRPQSIVDVLAGDRNFTYRNPGICWQACDNRMNNGS